MKWEALVIAAVLQAQFPVTGKASTSRKSVTVCGGPQVLARIRRLLQTLSFRKQRAVERRGACVCLGGVGGMDRRKEAGSPGAGPASSRSWWDREAPARPGFALRRGSSSCVFVDPLLVRPCPCPASFARQRACPKPEAGTLWAGSRETPQWSGD